MFQNLLREERFSRPDYGNALLVPAPKGNQNGARGKRWRDAIERALVRAGGGENEYDGVEPAPALKALDELADKFVKAAMAGPNYDKGDPWLGVVKEFGDRFDGKAPQQIQLSGDPDGEPIRQSIEQVIVDAKESK